MKRTSKWGIVGAVIFFLLFIFWFVGSYISSDSVINGLAVPLGQIIGYIVWPISYGWSEVFKTLHMCGDEQVEYIFYEFATVFLYLGAFGYGVGALLGWITTPRRSRL